MAGTGRGSYATITDYTGNSGKFDVADWLKPTGAAGGIDPVTTPTVVSYGADTLVVGNAIFSKPDRVAAVNAIRNACS